MDTDPTAKMQFYGWVTALLAGLALWFAAGTVVFSLAQPRLARLLGGERAFPGECECRVIEGDPARYSGGCGCYPMTLGDYMSSFAAGALGGAVGGLAFGLIQWRLRAGRKRAGLWPLVGALDGFVVGALVGKMTAFGSSPCRLGDLVSFAPIVVQCEWKLASSWAALEKGAALVGLGLLLVTLAISLVGVVRRARGSSG